MAMNGILISLLFTFGLIQAIYSSLLLFSDRFYEKMEHRVWKEKCVDEKDERQGRIYNKYVRGGGGLCLGLFIMGMIVHGSFF